MKFKDAIRLGHLNVITHKKRSLMLVVVIAATFSIVFAVNSILQGMKQNLPRIMNPVSEYYLIVGQRCNWELGKCETDLSVEVMEQIRTKVERYGGEVVQELEVVADRMALSREILQPMIVHDLAEAKGRVPVVLTISDASYLAQVSFSPLGNANSKLRTAEEVKRRVLDDELSVSADRYYPVGIVPSAAGVSSLSLKVVGDEMNILNPLLDLAIVSAGSSFVVEQASITGEKVGQVLVKFPNLERALEFTQKVGMCFETMQDCYEGDFVVQDVFNNPVATVLTLDYARMLVMGLSVILAVVAVIIMIFTSLRLIDQNSRTISLYHALGATRGDVCLIYFCYLLELCVLAAVLAVVVGMGLAAGLSLMNRQKLSVVLQLAYGVEGQTLWLLGWNEQMTAWVIVMLLMALLGIMVSLGYFSDRQLAKRLKS